MVGCVWLYLVDELSESSRADEMCVMKVLDDEKDKNENECGPRVNVDDDASFPDKLFRLILTNWPGSNRLRISANFRARR